MRILMSALLVCLLFTAVTFISMEHYEQQEPVLSQYIIRHFQEDARTDNAVTAVLLNYRMYDTMFEVLILLTAIIGMKQFLPGPKDLQQLKEQNGDAHEQR